MHIQPMTDEQRKAVALEYFKRMDRGEEILSLFDEHAQVYFPKWGIARGLDEISQLFDSLLGILAGISHDVTYANVVQQGDMVVVEATSHGQLKSGESWRAGVSHAGRWCDVFEIRDFRIQRCHIYLDPDYAGADTARYPWLTNDTVRRF
ncbi:nuclear transport factor 2 family protein [Paraburkholderia sediminicola]|uniref:nuclear transport factor 2 family protein n=1 Tax=Paraburkholderia sediminicola TaxID=458836 RepID=UPI0038BBC0B3